jgi:hypothetical protein
MGVPTERRSARGPFAPLALPAFVVILASLGPPAGRAGDLIVKQGTGRATAEIVEALIKEAPGKDKPPAVLDLSGDWNTDFARVSRVLDDGACVLAVGPNATVLAGAVSESQKKGRVVSLAVPNPERLKAKATYVAFYPRLDSVLRFLGTKFGAKNVGFIYSPSHNAAVARAFSEAATARGMKLREITVASTGDVVRHLKPALPEVDVLVVPVDPLVFDRDILRIVTDESKAAGKPTIGFLPDLTQLGLTGSLITPKEAVARAAWHAGRRTAAEGSDVVPVEGSLLYVSKGATTVVDPGPGEKR